MRVITKKALERFWAEHPQAESGLTHWHNVTTEAVWKTPADVKATFAGNADFVTTNKGSKVTVFDAAGNHCRIIAAVHYWKVNHINAPVYVLRVLTHEEYDKERWKDEL